VTAVLTPDAVLAALDEQIRCLRARDDRIADCSVTFDCSMMTDLGFDSISLLELICELESALGVGELPLNTWLAEESDKDAERFTVASFVAFVLAHARRVAQIAPPEDRVRRA